VGKTEIARRLAKLANSPFLKVEASKFTEVGYVGRDVESMVRDLVEIAIDNVREEKLEDVADKAELNAEERLAGYLLPPAPRPDGSSTAGGVVIDGKHCFDGVFEPDARKNCGSNCAKESWMIARRDRCTRAQFSVV